jgi:uncharacterized protein (TIGR00251 family)
MSITQTKDGVILRVYVKPGSSEFKFVFGSEGFVIFATEEPVKGKVNKEIIKKLSKLLHSRVEIVSGATSRQKQFLIRDLESSKVE